MDCSPPGSSVHGIFQDRILEWVAIAFSRGSSQPRDWTQVSCFAGRVFTDWSTREAMGVNTGNFCSSCACLQLPKEKDSLVSARVLCTFPDDRFICTMLNHDTFTCSHYPCNICNPSLPTKERQLDRQLTAATTEDRKQSNVFREKRQSRNWSHILKVNHLDLIEVCPYYGDG